jgi:hypothetical protein
MAIAPPGAASPRRLPGYVNMAAAAVVLAVVVVIALHAQSATQPAVAEFAPQAQQIRQAPPEQTAIVGQKPGAAIAPPGSPSPQVSPSEPPSGAILLPCVGDPPRQIEDPQSPPCVPYWQGANGGATARGVSGTAIRVAWVNQVQGTSSLYQPYFQAIATFFNRRFELYQRALVLSPPYQYPDDISPPAQRALADQVAADGNFGATEFPNQGGYVYHKELATKRVESVFGFEGNTPEPDLAASDPYLWSYEMASDNMLRSVASWYCAELAGKAPSHAGAVGVDLTKPRRLGVIWDPAGPEEQPPPQSFFDQLSSCQGSKVNYINDTAENDSGTMVNLIGDHDSSVMCLCRYIYWDGLTYYATDDGYQPEWLLNSYGGGDTFETFKFSPPDPQQVRHVFGLSYQPKQVGLANNPIWWAIHEGDPSLTPPASSGIYLITHFYRSMLILAAGVQMAGPDLTGQTFARHLQETVFPNPDTPIYAGHVSFLGSSHAFTTDTTQWWYDPTASSPFSAEGDSAGAMCYVEHGLRHDPYLWRGAIDRFFQGGCDSGA